MTRETLNIGLAPAEVMCARLGITELFEQADLLEIGCYRAALIALHGAPPAGADFHIERNVHDFGTYRELAARYDHRSRSRQRRSLSIHGDISR